jgi:hypothetical protein
LVETGTFVLEAYDVEASSTEFAFKRRFLNDVSSCNESTFVSFKRRASCDGDVGRISSLFDFLYLEKKWSRN